MTTREKKIVDPDDFLNTLYSSSPEDKNEEDNDYEQVVERLSSFAKKDETFIMFLREDQLVEKPLSQADPDDLVAWANLVLPIGDWSLAAKECDTKEKKSSFFFSIVAIRNACVFPSSKL